MTAFDREMTLSHDAVARTLSQLGGATYCWTPGDDRLLWSENARAVLGAERFEHACSGSAYGALIEAGSGLARGDAARGASAAPGAASGIRPFETIYCLSLPPGHAPRRLWIEDRGVGHFDREGGMVRVEGLVRRYAAGRPVHDSRGGVAAQVDRLRLTRMLEERLAGAYAEGGEFGFVLVGIDQLGQLNETYGFQVADEVADIVWMRLRNQLGEGEEIARFSGSKFGLVLCMEPQETLAGTAARFVAAVNATPPRTSAGAVAVSVSAGGLVAPRQARTVPEIFARAREALHAVRASARGTSRLYSPTLERRAEWRDNLRFADDIVSALANDRVTLAFQPIAHGASRKLAFHECLVRVAGREGGTFASAAIIPAAERFGLMPLIDRRTLELALAALEESPGLHLSVNVSPGSIHDGAWLQLMEERAAGGLGERLIVELTESVKIADLETVGSTVRWLHDLGCRVALDDFGVGYTSFRNLRTLGVDILKIDGSFICSLMQSAHDAHFVRALLDLSRNIGVETVAEWVQDEATAVRLVEWGCSYLQGELIGLASDEVPHA